MSLKIFSVVFVSLLLSPGIALAQTNWPDFMGRLDPGLLQSPIAVPVQGGAQIKAFCGIGETGKNWEKSDTCVLRARKGFGKSHVLAIRSTNHRNSSAAERTIFYPQNGYELRLIDALSSLHVVMPPWLQGKDAIDAWVQVWQPSIFGLML